MGQDGVGAKGGTSYDEEQNGNARNSTPVTRNPHCSRAEFPYGIAARKIYAARVGDVSARFSFAGRMIL